MSRIINRGVRQRVVVAAALAALAAGMITACSPSAQNSVDPTSSSSDSTAGTSPEIQMRDAITAGDLAAATAVLDAGLDLDAELGGGANALQRAASAGQSEIVQLLLDRGADIEATLNQKTVLMMAAVTGNYDTVTVLVRAGANQDVQDPTSYGMLAFHHAARQGNLEALQAFLDLGTDPDVLENTQSTALMYTAYYGYLEASQLLIGAAADLNIRDQGGHTALYWASNQNHPEIAVIIEAAGGVE